MDISAMNEELDEIWKEKFAYIPRYYRRPETNETNGLLTVGGNPSYVEKNIDKFIDSQGGQKLWNSTDFRWNRKHEKRVRLSHKEEIFSKNNLSAYYGHFETLKKRLECNWLHVDLYRYRETKQKDFYKLLKEHPNFAQKQVVLFEYLLKIVSPKLILVANSPASHQILQSLPIIERDGPALHEIEINGKLVPVILSRMIANGGIDIYSKARLYNYIEKIWKEESSV